MIRSSESKVESIARLVRDFFSLPRRPRYRPEQVLGYLRGQSLGNDPTTVEIRRMVERLPAILREPGVRRSYEGFQRYFDVLPRILFMYNRGVPSARIATDLSFLATEVGVETVVQITSRIVADRLNRAA